MQLGSQRIHSFKRPVLLQRSCRARAPFGPVRKLQRISRILRPLAACSTSILDNKVADGQNEEKHLPNILKAQYVTAFTTVLLAVSAAVLLLKPFLNAATLAAAFPQLTCLCAAGLFTQPKALQHWRIRGSSATAGSVIALSCVQRP